MTDRGEIARKADAAVALRLAGASYEEIAATLGYMSANRAAGVVERALATQVTDAQREQMRNVAGRRIERLLRGVWPKATDTNSPEHLAAVRSARDLIDRYCRLYGLDEPTEVVVRTPTTTEIDSWVANLLSHTEPRVVEHDVVSGEVLRRDVGPA